MLVLSRQRDETIMIGDEIEITIVDIRGDKVRLGINAPSRVAVHRKEVYDAIRAENERAALLRSELDPAHIESLEKSFTTSRTRPTRPHNTRHITTPTRSTGPSGHGTLPKSA